MPIDSDNIRERHSTRVFYPCTISDEDLQGILEAGIAAPSSKNRQPWRVDVFFQPEIGRYCDEMEELILSDTDGMDARMAQTRMSLAAIRTASAFLMVQFDGERDEYYHASLLSIGAMVENMCLEAQQRGIDSLWCCDILSLSGETERFFGLSRPIITLLALGKGVRMQSAPRKVFGDVVSIRR